MTTLLRLEGVGKRYPRARGQRRDEQRWALRDVDLEVHAGEVVSIIGRNGAGKSTLLKLATGVTRASAGTVLRVDRVAPLIEVGAGFHPDLTGRENVLVNGRLLGLSKSEVRDALDVIVGFAEMESAIDDPVQSYSSGMFMRLAFSVAIHTRPQLLLVDEVLAVGDLPFQVRCLDRIKQLRAEGAGVLFVSHNLAAVQQVSDRSVLIDRGRVLKEGSPSDVIGAYHLSLADVSGSPEEQGGVGSVAREGEALVLESTQLLRPDGTSTEAWSPASPAILRTRLRAVTDVPEMIFGIEVTSELLGPLMRWHNDHGEPLPAMKAGESVDVDLALILALGAGGYSIDLAVATHDWSILLLNRPQVVQFAVAQRDGARGYVDLGPELSVRRL